MKCSPARFWLSVLGALLLGALLLPVSLSVAGPSGRNTSGHSIPYTLLVADIPNLPASILTSGQVALAQGGSGFDGTNQAANCVWSGPASGGAGSMSCRALVLADGAGLHYERFYDNAASIVATNATINYLPPGTSTAASLSTTALPLFAHSHFKNVQHLCCQATAANALLNGGTVTYRVWDATTSAVKMSAVINAAAGQAPVCNDTPVAVADGDGLQMQELGSNTVSGGTTTGYYCEAVFSTY